MKNLNYNLNINIIHIIGSNIHDFYMESSPLEEHLFYEVGDIFSSIYNLELSITIKYNKLNNL